MGLPCHIITPHQLRRRIGTPSCPPIFDVRREAAFAAAESAIPTAAWRDHRLAQDWAETLTSGSEAVVYCVHGHQVSQSAAALLRASGIRARYLDGGIEAYAEAGGSLIARAGIPARAEGRLRAGQPSRWLTQAPPTEDGLAAGWFIRRFLDPQAAILFTSAEWAEASAAEVDAICFGLEGSELEGLDDFLGRFGIGDPALRRLTTKLSQTDCAEKKASEDRALIDSALARFDALYGRCREAADAGAGR